jgi:hypothetical protein
MQPDTPTYPTERERDIVCTSKLAEVCNVCPECAEQFVGAGIGHERNAVLAELDRMLGVCEYDEVRAFIPLLQNHLRQGRHRNA